MAAYPCIDLVLPASLSMSFSLLFSLFRFSVNLVFIPPSLGGHVLLIFLILVQFWIKQFWVKQVKFGNSRHFLESTFEQWPEIWHADVSRSLSRLFRFWSLSVEFLKFWHNFDFMKWHVPFTTKIFMMNGIMALCPRFEIQLTMRKSMFRGSRFIFSSFYFKNDSRKANSSQVYRMFTHQVFLG